MTYIQVDESKPNNRWSATIDLVRFTRDLAKALNTLLPSVDNIAVVTKGDYPHERQQIRVGADVLELSAVNYKKRISAYITAPDVAYGDWSTYDKDQKTVDASVNPDGRSIESIARDLNRRVIEANQPALAARRAHAERQKQARANIVTEAAKLKAACPGLDVRVNEREQSAAIYSGPSDYYLSGRLDADGRVSLDRIGAVSAATFRKIVKALESEKGGDK